jgi:hypothetical protein
MFISYAWVDNQADDEQPNTGWVAQFRERPIKRVDQKLGRTGAARVFFDTWAIGHNQDFSPQIADALSSTAVVIAIFSPGYIKSKACLEELTHFNRAVKSKLSQSGLLFLVRLDEVPDSKWPVEIADCLGKELIGFQFYKLDPASRVTMPLEPEDKPYQEELGRLRTAIAKQLEVMREAATMGSAPPGNVAAARSETNHGKLATAAPLPTILVAQSTPDLRKKREKLVEYCENSQLRVLGKTAYAPDEFQSAFQADLAQVHLFVQLLSPSYSDPPKDMPQGLERWQLEQASSRKIPVLQWRDETASLDDLDDADPHRQLLLDPEVRRSCRQPFIRRWWNAHGWL